MSFPALERYLARLYGNAHAGMRVWVDAEGRALGRYFNSTLTSAFQPVRELGSGHVIGYEGFARSYSESDQGLCLWKLLDHAASDDESVELDRLCRILHAVNFFHQSEAAGKDLYLSVHARLLAAVEGNHGTAFSRILRMLELPQERIVLQLPQIVEHQSWLVNYVVDNYRRNGFRIAVNAVNPADALALVRKVNPAVVKVDARHLAREAPALGLLKECGERGVEVIFKRVESGATHDALMQLLELSGIPFQVQGFYWHLPHARLVGSQMPARLLVSDGTAPVQTAQATAQ
jgi:EAL domain-containing protein (putative c-di-GMP-specific phosphodiesterase class I)